MNAPAASSFYVTGGTLRQGAPSYVERQADRDLYAGLIHGEFCYVLTSRQMGKSSLMVHTAARLRAEGMAVVILDLTAIGQNLSVEQWYGSLLGRLGWQLDLEEELEQFWLANERLGPLDRWMRALREVVLPRLGVGSWELGRDGRGQSPTPNSPLPNPRLVLFLDEIDAVRSLPFSTDEFFAAIRECYNRRSQEPGFGRLTFCLLGVASPSDLIRDARMTPFNIGRRIELTDFTAAEAGPLAKGLAQDENRVKEILRRVLHWTGGHPYLTQRLCRAIAEANAADGNPTSNIQYPKSEVDRHCKALFLSPTAQEKDDNLLFVRERLLRSEADPAALIDLYAKVRAGQRVGLDDTNPLIDLLRLSGAARVADGRLVVRNRIYERVFDRGWVTTHMPDAEQHRQRAAYRRGLVRATAVAVVVVAVMAGLALTAISQSQRTRVARRLAEANAMRARRLAGSLSEALNARTRALADLQASLKVTEAQRARANTAAAAARQARDRSEAARRLAERSAAFARWQQGLAQTSSRKERRAVRYAQELLARAQLEGGVRLLEAGTGTGLVHVLQAYQTAADLPQLEQSIASVWAGWHTAVAGRLVWVMGHARGVGAMVFSPDGKILATGSLDGTARLWETATGKPEGPPLRHGGRVLSVAFSPEGPLLATASADGKVRLWDTATGRPHGSPLPQHGGAVRAVAFSPDGKLLATGCADHTAQLWAGGPAWGAPGSRRVAWPWGHPLRLRAPVVAVEFSPNGKLLATVCQAVNGYSQLWETTTGRPQGQELPLRLANAPAFSPDGKLFAAGGSNGSVCLLRTTTGQSYATPTGHSSTIWSLAFSPDSRFLATASADGTARLWRTADGKPFGQPLVHEGPVRWVTFSPDGKLLATASADGTARLWSTASGQPVGSPLWHQGTVLRAAFSPDGKLLATASLDGNVRLWKTWTAAAPSHPWGPPLRHPHPINQVVFSPDGTLLATASADGCARLWQTATGQPYGQPLCLPESVWGVAFSPDGKLLATGSDDDTAQLWRIASDQPFGPPLPHHGRVNAVAFSPDGKLLATGSFDGTVGLWQTATGRRHTRPLLHSGSVLAVALSPDGKSLASTTDTDGTVWLWDTASGQLRGPLVRHTDPIWTMAFSPDGKLLATGGEDSAVRLWDAATGQPRGQPLRHQKLVRSVAFSSDGKLVASASFDGTARIWDRLTGQPCGPPLRHPDSVYGVALSPHLRLVATACSDGNVRLWPLSVPPTSLREIELRTWVALGARLNGQGVEQAIPWQEWRGLREELQALEGRSSR